MTTFAAPVVAGAIGWATTVRLYVILLLVFALLNFIFGDRHERLERHSLIRQIRNVYKNWGLWFLSLFYFITFGSFVAFTVFLPRFLVSDFSLSSTDAGVRTAGFIVLATLIRPVGGYLSDRWNPYTVLTIIFAGLAAAGILLSFSLTILWFTIGCLVVSACAGIGNGAIFKLVPHHFSKQSGIANGIVSAAGGLGGFFPPIMLTTLHHVTGQYAIGFMALSEVSLASLILVLWMSFRERSHIARKISPTE